MLFKQRLRADQDACPRFVNDDSFARRVTQLRIRTKGQVALPRATHNGFTERMLGMLLGDCSGLKHVILCCVVERAHSCHFGNSEGKGAGFVQYNCVDPAELFEIKPALRNDAAPGCATDSSQDRQRRSRRNATRTRDDDHRDSRSDIARNDEREHRRAKREIHKPSREAVRNALDRRAGFFRLLHDLDDFAECCVAPDFLDGHFENAILVDRAGEDFALLHLFNRQRLAGDRGLIYETVTFANDAVGRNTFTGPNDDRLAGDNVACTQLAFLAVASHPHLARQGVDQVLDRPSPTANGIAFDELGKEHKKRDHQRGQKLPNTKRCEERDRHRQFHRHAALAQVLPRLFENGESADKRGRKCKPVARHEMAPPSRKAGDDDQRHQPETYVFRAARFVMTLLGVLVMTVPIVIAVPVLEPSRLNVQVTWHMFLKAKPLTFSR